MPAITPVASDLISSKVSLLSKLNTANNLINSGMLTNKEFIPSIEKTMNGDIDVYSSMVPYFTSNSDYKPDPNAMNIYRQLPTYGGNRFMSVVNRFNDIGSKLVNNPNNQDIGNEFVKVKLASMSPSVMEQFAQQYNYYNKQKKIPLALHTEDLPNGVKVWNMIDTTPHPYQAQPSYYLQNKEVMEQNKITPDKMADIVNNRLEQGAKENWQSMAPAQVKFLSKSLNIPESTPEAIQKWIEENPKRAKMIKVDYTKGQPKIYVNNVINPIPGEKPTD